MGDKIKAYAEANKILKAAGLSTLGDTYDALRIASRALIAIQLKAGEPASPATQSACQKIASDAMSELITQGDASNANAVPDEYREFVEAIADGYSYTHIQTQETHCMGCNCSIDDNEPHKSDCITLRAKAFLTTTKEAA